MLDSTWSRYMSKPMDELEELLACFEARTNHYYREGDYRLGHEYYLICCEIGMAITYKEGLRRQLERSL